MKRYNTLLFSAEFSLTEEQGLENRKLRKLFGKGRRRRRKMSRKKSTILMLVRMMDFKKIMTWIFKRMKIPILISNLVLKNLHLSI